MADVAAIDGVTGPGRRTLLFQEGIQEITFRLKKKVIEVVNRDGSMGSYDLVQVKEIAVTSTGNDDFTLSITSIPVEDTDERTRADADRAKLDAGTKPTTEDSTGSAEGASDRAAEEYGEDRTAEENRATS